MQKRFVFAREERPGEAWAARFRAGRADAERWYRGEKRAAPPTPEECRAAVRQHMPELLARYDEACSLLGDDQLGRCIVSHWRAGPLGGGCSQAVWLGAEGPALVRNYDYALAAVTDRFESTQWLGPEVIAKAQRPWGGCIDGMNDDGLAGSLTFVSGPFGRGFSVLLMLRYVLETCRSVKEAVAALCRIPIAQPHNVTLLDRGGNYATLFLRPESEPAVTRNAVATNHQEKLRPTDSVLRRQALLRALEMPATLDSLTRRFFERPLFSRRQDSPTVYTAVYRPGEGRVDYLWPGQRRTQHFGRFSEGDYTHDYAQERAD
ncbi:MAG TPA: C45 family autoproteolytic acyltransferase/hydrolase [Kiloniellales bacterium]|nr:C45 family autoproteolytic acyltransferase/hydrolase [Kiloniellales bacterium]